MNPNCLLFHRERQRERERERERERWCFENIQSRSVLLIWKLVGQGSIALAVGAGGGCLDISFSRLSFLSHSLGDGPI